MKHWELSSGKRTSETVTTGTRYIDEGCYPYKQEFWAVDNRVVLRTWEEGTGHFYDRVLDEGTIGFVELKKSQHERISEYCVLVKNDSDELMNLVTAMLREGWRCQGSIGISCNGYYESGLNEGSSIMVFAQAMIR